MTDIIDNYLINVIGKGDSDSKLLARLTAPTLKNCGYVDVINEGMNGIAVLKNLPHDHDVVVYTLGGDPNIKDLAHYTESVVGRLLNVAYENNFMPLAFADVIDAHVSKQNEIKLIGNVLRDCADENGLAILNGEMAIIDYMNGTSINGTMVALSKRGTHPRKPFEVNVGGIGPVYIASFEHQGKPVYINSDGEGSKSEFEIRTKKYSNCLLNSAAMKLDDLIKIGAEAKVVSDLIQTRGDIPMDDLKEFAGILSREFKIEYILQQETTHDRINGYNEHAPAFNISGSSVSLIDEHRLKNPLKPGQGEYVVAIRGHPNPRSNGITDKRKLMVEWLGNNYHETELGQEFLKYLAAPSIVFYPHFKELIDSDLVTSVYHMSGGAYNGKLARPLAKHNLFASLINLFEPDYRELELMKRQNVPVDVAYAKWPMGNDGFVTTLYPTAVINYLENQGLEGRVVGIVEKNDEKTGVELMAFNGEKIHYSGK